MKTKRKAGITLLAIILGLIISPAVAIEDSIIVNNLANFKITDTFYQKETTILPSVDQPSGH